MAVAVDQESHVNTIMGEIVSSMKDLYGNYLRQVILFGSYARGDQGEYSDMDIVVLVDIDGEELRQYSRKIVDTTSDISIKYGILLSIIDINYQHFQRWVPHLPFYENVKMEGIEFYANP